jgi:branched-chain amino acid transport system ATP-binding protein
MNQPFLEVQNLDVRYGQVQALRDFNLHVNEGEVVVVVGSNGAGKTTLMKTVVGLLKPTGGSITFQGEKISGKPVHSIVKKGLCLIPEGRMVFGDQTVHENLLLGAYWRRRKMSPEEINRALEDCFVRFPRLKDRRDQLAGTLSGGEQQMLAISRGLMSKPSLLLIDEPSLGLAPILIEEVFETIRTLNEEGITVLLVEQMAAVALQFAKRGYVLEHGSVLIEGKAKELMENKDIVESYLGRD